MGTFDKIHDNKIIIASKEQDQLLSSFYNILNVRFNYARQIK